MPKLTPQQHWDQVVKREDRGARARRKLTANRHRNWLVALAAHACAKAQAGGQLSDLEHEIVEALRKGSHKTDLVAGFAYVQSHTPPEVKNEIFPSSLAGLSANDSITFAKLGQLAPDLAKQTITAPNATELDIRSMHLNHVKLSQLKVPTSTLGMYSSSLTRLVNSSEASPGETIAKPATAATAAIANRYSIKAKSFRCLEETSEWSSSDEVYWLYACVAQGANWGSKLAGMTHVFNGVDAGEYFPFEANEGCIWGFDCQPQTFPNGEIGALITLMEHDEGDLGDIRDGFFSLLGIADTILLASGVAAWVAALVSAIGGLIGVILAWMEDDHIADVTYTWNRAAMDSVLTDKYHNTFYDTKPELSDGDARYRLELRLSRVV